MPAGKAVECTLESVPPAVLVSADDALQFRTPRGPSAIFRAGMPSRWFGCVSIQPLPLSMATFSSAVMRSRRSATRSSTAAFEFLYIGDAPVTGCSWDDTAGAKHSRSHVLAYA